LTNQKVSSFLNVLISYRTDTFAFISYIVISLIHALSAELVNTTRTGTRASSRALVNILTLEIFYSKQFTQQHKIQLTLLFN